MKFPKPTQQRQIVSSLICISAALSLPVSNANALEGVEITGTNTEYASRNAGENTMRMTRANLCSPMAPMMISGAMDSLRARLNPRLGDMAAAAGVDLPDGYDILDAMAKLCEEEDDFSTDLFNITYAQCRMTMDSAGQMMDILIPPGGAEGKMDVVDFGTSEAMRIMLQRDLGATAAVVGSGWHSDIDMNSQGLGGRVAGYPTTKYNFSYSGGLGGGIVPMASQVSTTNSGTAWISDQVDGIAIVKSFYETFTSEIDSSQGEGSFMSGLIKNLVGMLENGIPLKMDSLVESKLSGMSIMSGRSTMEVHTVRVVPLPSDWCEQDFIPPGMTIRDVNEEINAAMGGAGNAEMSATMSDAQSQYQEAMDQLTPEQQEMMRNMGMGNMGQIMGGAVETSPNTAATTGKQRSPAAQSSPDSYYSDNVTQMVQRQLKALGYDPGNTDGVESLETSIAISQFQAENKMAVTGKASPQLAGVLSARLEGN